MRRYFSRKSIFKKNCFLHPPSLLVVWDNINLTIKFLVQILSHLCSFEVIYFFFFFFALMAFLSPSGLVNYRSPEQQNSQFSCMSLCCSWGAEKCDYSVFPRKGVVRPQPALPITQKESVMSSFCASGGAQSSWTGTKGLDSWARWGWRMVSTTEKMFDSLSIHDPEVWEASIPSDKCWSPLIWMVELHLTSVSPGSECKYIIPPAINASHIPQQSRQGKQNFQ